jgi:hypothetical protein
MEGEKIYFDEEVKGHNLLVSSHAIIFKGKRFDTSAVDGASAVVFRQSVNGVPNASSYKMSVTSRGDTITVECARFGGFFRFGKTQYERLRSAIGEAVEGRLIRDALGKLIAGELLIFEHNGSLFEKDSRFTLSRVGIHIEQKGALSRKATMIEWRHLRMQTHNGTCFLQCYCTGKKVSFQMWHMSNNIVFSGVLHTLLDKANYRLLETTPEAGKTAFASSASTA